jgi:AcrR family transcriptional regulator
MARKYELKRRAERQEETRRRIVAAAVALHEAVGPARTTISAVAERAGVERLTVYRHFPDADALLGACSAHWATAHPVPDPESWRAEPDPVARLRRALGEVYAFYRGGEPMLVHVYRDAPELPALQAILAGNLSLVARMQDILAPGWEAPPERKPRLRAALGHSLDFTAWRSLALGQGLSDTEAADLMVGLVRAAAGDSRAPAAYPSA